jgi:hypothetical protein
MKLNSLKELFGVKGLFLSAILFAFCYVVGFVGGLLLELFYDFRGKDALFLGMPMKHSMGLVLAFGSWAYMLWLLIEKTLKTKKGLD